MRIRINRQIIVFFSLLFLITFSTLNLSFGQCNLKIDSKIEKVGDGPDSNIQLKVVSGQGSINFHLIDLNNPQNGPIQTETKSTSQLKDEFVVVFRNVPPSNYTIQAIDENKCQISIGAVAGIIISSN